MLEPHEAEAVLAIALMAALADGRSGEAEREQIRSLFEALEREGDLPSPAQLHQRVLLRQTTLAEQAARLTTPEAKRMGFEIAVCVADADGSTTPEEQRFLDELESRLGLDHGQAVAFEREAEAIALAPTTDAPLDAAALLGPAAAAAPAVGTRAEPLREDPRAREVDTIVLRYAMLNGALELLPQNLATMAILPLQTRMVYAVGRTYGHTLGPAHIKEFIATLGLGATSQMLENFARKAIGTLAKKTMGKTAGKIAKAATGPMMTFATTYAIGQVAKAYYAGGRRLSAVDLRALFQRDLEKGRSLYAEHRPRIEAEASTLNPARVLELVRGKAPV